MAPNFSGDKDTDHMGISVLNAIALKVCSHSLRTGGTLLMKTLHGALEGEFFVKILYLITITESIQSIFQEFPENKAKFFKSKV